MMVKAILQAYSQFDRYSFDITLFDTGHSNDIVFRYSPRFSITLTIFLLQCCSYTIFTGLTSFGPIKLSFHHPYSINTSVWGISLSFTEFYWVLLGFTGFYCPSHIFTGFYWLSHVCTGFYWLSHIFTEFYWVFLGFTGFCWVLLVVSCWLLVVGFPLGVTKCYWVLLSFTGFFWVILGFTGFNWVLLGFTGFYWVSFSLRFIGFY